MAQFEKRKRETLTHEYVMTIPVNLGEFSRTMSAAYTEYSKMTGKKISDDSLWVTRTDEEIIIYWEETK